MTSPHERAAPFGASDVGEDRDPDGRASDADVTRALVAGSEAREAAVPRQFKDVPSRRLKNSSEMLARPGWLHRAIWHVVFKGVTFDERHLRTIREAHRDGDVVFVMNHHSLLDYLYFNYAFVRFGLPLVYFANSISMTGFRPWWELIQVGLGRLLGHEKVSLSESDQLAYGLERKRPALVFLKRKGLWPWSADSAQNEYLERLLQSQRERLAAAAAVAADRSGPDSTPADGTHSDDTGTRARRITVVPQLLVWSQNPNKYKRSLPDLVFGDPEAPGRLRKAINFVLNRRRAFVQLGQPIDLVDFLARQESDRTEAELAPELGFTIRQMLSLEERVIKGPILKDAKRMRQEILRTPEVQSEVRRIAEETGESTAHVEANVARYLKEMSADFSMAYVEVMCVILTVVLDRLYSETVIDLEGLEGVREAGRKAPLILLPCHRSHVDYLLISYVFYVNGLITPHIAAGANLNFFPLGKIFRRSGAFFIRRSFRENETYRVTFREYLRKLVREGYWIEFFPEGGRSRTGKMLAPKFGVLRTVLEAIRAGAAPDAYLVPIYVGYEQVIEERAYTKELSGATDKKRENITGLLKTTQVLWKRYGRLYLSFSEPLSVKDALDRADLWDADPESEEYQDFVRRTAYQVLRGIQDVALVTPTAVTALGLLAHPKRGVRREVLLRRVGMLLDLASTTGAPISKTLEHALKIRRQEVAAAVEELEDLGLPRHPLALGEASPVALARGRAVVEAVDEALQRWVRNKQVEQHSFTGEGDEAAEGTDDGDAGEAQVVYTPVPDERINLEFYKNNIVHLLVLEGILAAAARGVETSGEVDLASLRDAAKFLSSTLKFDFIYDPDRPFREQFAHTVATFREAGLLVEASAGEGQTLRLPDPGTPQADVVGQTLRLPDPGTPQADVVGQTLRLPDPGTPQADMVALLHQVIAPLLESYWVLAQGLADLSPDEQVPEKEFVRRMARRASQSFQEGEITSPEASSTVAFQNALNAYLEMGHVERVAGKGREKLLRRPPDSRSAGTATAPQGPDGSRPDPLAELASSLRRFLPHA